MSMKRIRKPAMSFSISSLKEPVEMLRLMEFERSISIDRLEYSSGQSGLGTRLKAYLLIFMSRGSMMYLITK